jgi:hypothetical protein
MNRPLPSQQTVVSGFGLIRPKFSLLYGFHFACINLYQRSFMLNTWIFILSDDGYFFLQTMDRHISDYYDEQEYNIFS